MSLAIRATGVFAALWGVGGVTALLVFAVYRLGQHTLTALDYDWSWFEWTVCLVNVGFMAWSEGYRGFQQAFSPRTVSRAHYLLHKPGVLTTLFAPLFCAGYFGAARRVQMVVWIGTFGIVLLVLLLQQFSQPWRGIIDAGVVVGLSWGTTSLLATAVGVFFLNRTPADPRLPDRVGAVAA